MTRLDTALVDAVKKLATIDWQEKRATPAWFALSKPCPVSELQHEQVLMLIKARNERYIELNLKLDLASLWETAKAKLAQIEINNESELERFWLTERERFLRQLLHGFKLTAEQLLMENLVGQLPRLKTLDIPQAQHFLIVEPGLRSGIKLLAANSEGEEVSHSIVFPHEPQNQWQQGMRKFGQFCQTTKAQHIVLLTGEGFLESRRFLKEWLNEQENTLPVYLYDSMALDILCARQYDVLEDSLHFRVRQAARLVVSPQRCFEQLPLQCLLSEPLKTTINPWHLESALRVAWNNKISDGELLKIDPLSSNNLRTLSDLKVGQSVTSRVVNTTDFGYFLDVGIESNGLLHNSQLKAGTVCNVGDTLDVFVEKINPNKSQFSLCRKKARPSSAKNISKKSSGKPRKNNAPGNSAMADALKAAMNKKL